MKKLEDVPTACASCGRTDRPVAKALGLCASCIREKGGAVLGAALRSHTTSREGFGLPATPPSERGILCRICSQHCRMGEGQAGYCGLRWNEAGRLVSLSTPDAGLFYACIDPHVTNCCAAFFCPAATGLGYPEFAYTPGPEIGYENLSIFLYGCNFDCLFCQNPSHKEIHRQGPRPVDELIEMTLQNDRISCWCFFGGSPEPQLPFAVNASRKVLARIIHEGSSRNRAVAKRDRRAEPRGREAYLKQYVDRPSGEPACWHAAQPHASLSQRRIRDCSRSVHE